MAEHTSEGLVETGALEVLNEGQNSTTCRGEHVGTHELNKLRRKQEADLCHCLAAGACHGVEQHGDRLGIQASMDVLQALHLED